MTGSWQKLSMHYCMLLTHVGIWDADFVTVASSVVLVFCGVDASLLLGLLRAFQDAKDLHGSSNKMDSN
jgi:hypothetical protein